MSSRGGMGSPSGPIATMRPRGGGADDAPALTAALAAGPVALVHRAAYAINTPITLASYAHLYGNGAILNMAITPGDGSSACALLASRSRVGADLTLAANVTVGASAFTTTTDPALKAVTAGAWVTIYDVNLAQSYLVKSVTGVSNPWTIHVERPILLPFLAASAKAFSSTQPTGIRVIGDGMQIIATLGDRAIEFAGVWDCAIEDVGVVSSGTGLTNFGVSFDDGTLRSWMRDVTVDGGGTVLQGIAAESCEAVRLVDCLAHDVAANGTNAGIYVYSGRDVIVRGGSACNCDNGITLDYSGTLPSSGCEITGGRYSSNRVTGIYLSDGGISWKLTGIAAGRNPYGLVLANGLGAVPVGTTISNCSFNDCTTQGVDLTNASKTTLVGCETSSAGVDGVSLETGSSKTQIVGHKADACARWGVLANGNADAVITNYRSDGCGTGGSGGALSANLAAVVTLDGFDLSATYNGAAHMIDQSGTGTMRIGCGRITTSGTSNKLSVCTAGGTITARNVVCSGGATSFGLFINGGGAIKYDESVDVSGCNTPLSGGTATTTTETKTTYA